ncbi:23S rRNA (guanosine(2251)-2'-O)-methyltransferase RlmB [Arthrobacter castelli]|uniref:23S rRNA (guanosine(2251)-2'-O)-methyltransferase RlmB n=1 Tax=Arthrobacter castelli TaxID=271431 RepID=UPI0003F505FF|nr:23S rRNA (guanosine(2251)-2'-O)-methyltransferase RlmB [Arthrobacter castelli]
MANKSRPGAVRKNKKGPTTGTGGHGKKALQGKGPTPKAEDRPYHKAHKQKAANERQDAKSSGGAANRSASRGSSGRAKPSVEMVTGRNSVVEALRAGVPAKALHVAVRIETDDRVREALKLAAEQGIGLLEVHKPELDRMTGDAIHQGLALQIPPYDYPDAVDLMQQTVAKWKKGHIRNAPLFVALDGITDPRNLGAIIRSVSAFSGHGVLVPERRSVGMTASAWKTSAGAAVRVPVAKAGNLNRTLEAAKKQGIFVLGLDGDGDVSLPDLDSATEPVCLVVGSEGKGLSRLTRQTCDQIVSIPIDSSMESLNASMAVGVSLYEISRRRSGRR